MTYKHSKNNTRKIYKPDTHKTVVVHQPVKVPIVEQRKKKSLPEPELPKFLAYCRLHGGFEVRVYEKLNQQTNNNLVEWDMAGVFGVDHIITESGQAHSIEQCFKVAEQRYRKLKEEHGY